MNKQELIEKYKNKYPVISMDVKEFRYFIELWEDMKQLDEPQKPVVPQFVADWYEEHKDDFETELFQCIYKMPNIFEMNKLSKFEEWLIDEHTKPFQTLVNMHQFGYEVEKEKRYLVKLKCIHPESEYLYYGMGSCKWRFRGKNESGCFRKNHTRKELEEAGFGEVFNSPLFEVEEVTE